ncbi:MAG: YjbH domain-containing protein [FCB group bacterium]|nr:YjbH domain-containing protein [FCB group bacterium]
MRRPGFIILFGLLAATTLSAQTVAYPPPTHLITIPTAGVLVRGSFAMEMRVQKAGGLSIGLSTGITDRFQFGVSYGASQLIGDTAVAWYPRPEASIKYRMIDETEKMPGISIGIDTQGFGAYHSERNQQRYDMKSYGLYLAASKNWKTPLGNMGLHAGSNYSFTERDDGDSDPNLFFGWDMELNPELSLLLEYNAALNENNLTAQTMSLTKSGYLNGAVRWTFVEHLHIEMDFNNLLFDQDKVTSFNREIKITYIEYF